MPAKAGMIYILPLLHISVSCHRFIEVGRPQCLNHGDDIVPGTTRFLRTAKGTGRNRTPQTAHGREGRLELRQGIGRFAFFHAYPKRVKYPLRKIHATAAHGDTRRPSSLSAANWT